jgi:hypothetical protein
LPVRRPASETGKDESFATFTALVNVGSGKPGSSRRSASRRDRSCAAAIIDRAAASGEPSSRCGRRSIQAKTTRPSIVVVTHIAIGSQPGPPPEKTRRSSPDPPPGAWSAPPRPAGGATGEPPDPDAPDPLPPPAGGTDPCAPPPPVPEDAGVRGGFDVGFVVGLVVGFVVGFAVGFAVGFGVGAAVGFGVGAGVGFGVGAGVGAGVGFGVGFGVGAGVGVGFGVGATTAIDPGVTFVRVTVRRPAPVPEVARKLYVQVPAGSFRETV